MEQVRNSRSDCQLWNDPIGRAGGGCRARPFRYRPFYEQLPPTSRTEVTRICCVALSLLLRDELAAPGSADGFAPPAELLLESLFDNVPFTSTFLPTSVEKFEALPVSLYVVPDIDELVDPAAPAVGLPGVEPAVPVALDEPLDIDASVRM